MSRPPLVLTLRFPSRGIAVLTGLLILLAVGGLVYGLARWMTPRHETTQLDRMESDRDPNAQLADKKLNARVEALLRVMTPEEKIGQLTQYSAGALTGPGTGRDDYDVMVQKGQVGSLFNIIGAKETNRYQHLAVEKSSRHIPLLFAYDVIHGAHTVFPVPLALASSFDPRLVRELAHVAAQEASDDGIKWVFSPMVDIARDARWGRITEGAGEDTFLGSVMAQAYVQGYQGDDLGKSDAVAACVKHFAAYGAPNAGREYNTVDMSELTLRQVYLPPYHAAVRAGAATVMSAFNPLNGVPATADPFTLTRILRHEWSFDGVVVSDFGAIRELTNHGIAPTSAIATRKAISSGVDMDMESDLYRTKLGGLLVASDLPLSVIDEAARRILRVKFALGLFDHPYADENRPPFQMTTAKRDLARHAAEETLVLLKNTPALPYRSPVLPLDKGAKTIALIGPLADSPIDMLGSWPGAGLPADAVTLRTSLRDRCLQAETTLLYSQGTDILSDSDSGFEAALAAARKADVVVLALGESASKMTGESSSLTRLDLPGNQERLLEAVTRLGKPTVLVLFDGRPLAIKWAAAHVPAIIEAWYPGIEAGPAVANILFGDVNPSGKLPATFPRAVGQEPLYYNQLPTGRPATDVDLTHPPTGQDKYFSRYIDETNSPLYPFGYGLSYTHFEYAKVKVSQETITVKELLNPPHRRLFVSAPGIRVTAEIRNTGPVTGTEVVQLYLRNTGGTLEQPVRELKGFQRVTLAAGQSRQVEFKLEVNELANYNLDMERTIEPTQFQVWVGGSSEATEGTQFQVTP